jgi:DNA-binding MarR family transcriptional regulator
MSALAMRARRATTDAGIAADERVVRAFLAPRRHDPDVVSVAFHLYRVTQEAIARAEAEVLRPRGLTWVSYVTLMALWVRGASEVRALARGQVVSKPAVVKSLHALERADYVRRVRSKTDRRLVTVELRPQGRAVIRRIQPEVHRREHVLTGRLTIAEKRALARLLRKLDPTSTATRRNR